jgi:hypothetical protein
MVLRTLEPWESGVNIIVNEKADESVISVAAKILGTDTDWLRQVIEAREPLPIARVETSAAETIEKMLRAAGLECRLVTDDELNGQSPPVRLRGIRSAGDQLEFILFNTGDRVRVAKGEMTHLVSGKLYRSQTRLLEKQSRNERKLLDEAQTADDEAVIDIYTLGERFGYRVMQHGFDFSVLGEERDLLATKNMVILVKFLANFAPQIKVCDSYNDLRNHLGNVWPPEDRKDPTGIKRSGLGRHDLSSVRSSNNLLQFTKYSRLQSLF